jgi:hypothetical protein
LFFDTLFVTFSGFPGFPGLPGDSGRKGPIGAKVWAVPCMTCLDWPHFLINYISIQDDLNILETFNDRVVGCQG